MFDNDKKMSHGNDPDIHVILSARLIIKIEEIARVQRNDQVFACNTCLDTTSASYDILDASGLNSNHTNTVTDNVHACISTV